MDSDLTHTVIGALRAQKGNWKAIAEALAPDVSYSFISQLGRGKYKSAPSYRRLKLLADHLNIPVA